MIPLGRRQPHDEKTPEQTIAHVVREWESNPLDVRDLPAAVIEALTYKAYFEGSESALLWLDPGANVLERIGVRPEYVRAARQEASEQCTSTR